MSRPPRPAPAASSPSQQSRPGRSSRRPATTGCCLVRTRPAHWTPQERTPRPPLRRSRPRRRHRHHPPFPPAHTQSGADHPVHQDSRLRTPHRPPYRMPQFPQDPPGTTEGRAPGSRNGLDGQRSRLHHSTGRPLDPTNLSRLPLRHTGLRTIRFHDLRHSTATLLLEQGVDLVVTEELLSHAHIGVTAGLHAHVRLRLERQAIDTLGTTIGPTDALDGPPTTAIVC